MQRTFGLQLPPIKVRHVPNDDIELDQPCRNGYSHAPYKTIFKDAHESSTL